jgi:16S rRNA G966 N2-methylase RsmD
MNFGLKECDEFFLKHRFKVKMRNMSRDEFYAMPIELMKEYEQKFIARNFSRGEAQARRSCYDLYYGCCTNFRPACAIELFKRVNATKVLDPCSGWGGRCFAAMSQGLDYHGFDTNKDMEEDYRLFIDKYRKKGEVKVIFEDSAKADFSKIEYDCLFTSPPYNKRECYNNMPDYKDKKDFIKKFIQPMIENGWKHLKDGGSMAINVPENIYEAIVPIFRECDDKIIYNARYRQSLKREKTKREYIYIWRK